MSVEIQSRNYEEIVGIGIIPISSLLLAPSSAQDLFVIPTGDGGVSDKNIELTTGSRWQFFSLQWQSQMHIMGSNQSLRPPRQAYC